MMTTNRPMFGAILAVCTLAALEDARANAPCSNPQVDVSGDDATARWVAGDCRAKLVGPVDDFRKIKAGTLTYSDLPAGSYKFRVRRPDGPYSDDVFKIATSAADPDTDHGGEATTSADHDAGETRCSNPQIEISGNDATAMWAAGDCRIKLVGPVSDFRAVSTGSHTYGNLPDGNYIFRVRPRIGAYANQRFQITGAHDGGDPGAPDDAPKPPPNDSPSNDRPSDKPGGGVPIILDTDFGGDVDDVGALAVLNTLHNRGEARILAVMSVAWLRHSVAGIDAVNSYYGNPDIPIGRHAGGARNAARDGYIDALARFPHDQTAADAPPADQLYRKVLASQPDRSVVVATIGQLRNLQALLSTTDGRALFNRKVKYVVLGGGYFPNPDNRVNANFRGTDVARSVVDAITVPVVFKGSRIGLKKNGWKSDAATIRSMANDNPVRAGYEAFFRDPPNYAPRGAVVDWNAWDQIVVLEAVRPKRYFGHFAQGVARVDRDGSVHWQNTPDSDHAYLLVQTPASQVSRVFNELMGR